MLSEFKIKIKNLLIDEFDVCYWLYDEQVMKYCQDAYYYINKAENLFRAFITNYMILNFGANWWEVVLKPIQNKKSCRRD